MCCLFAADVFVASRSLSSAVAAFAVICAMGVTVVCSGARDVVNWWVVLAVSVPVAELVRLKDHCPLVVWCRLASPSSKDHVS